MTTEEDPFAVLGIAPTTDLMAIKRAYFAALKLHPPHQDVEGFRRLRVAYEALQSPQRRTALALGSPLDVGGALAPLEARYGAAITQARSQRAPEPVVDDRAEVFARTFSRLPLRDAVARLPAKNVG